jgi:hypothetical protein
MNWAKAVIFVFELTVYLHIYTEEQETIYHFRLIEKYFFSVLRVAVFDKNTENVGVFGRTDSKSNVTYL